VPNTKTETKITLYIGQKPENSNSLAKQQAVGRNATHLGLLTRRIASADQNLQ
jgi:hypothetical protein